MQPTFIDDEEDRREADGDNELRLSLWSLEALYKISNTMATSIQTIELAVADVTRETEEVYITAR